MGGIILITSILIFRVGVGWDQVSAQYIIQNEDTLYLDNDIKFFLERISNSYSATLNLSSLSLSGNLDLWTSFHEFKFSSNLIFSRYHDEDSLHLNQVSINLSLDYNPAAYGIRLESRLDRYSRPSSFFQNLNNIGLALYYDFDHFDYNLGIELNADYDNVIDSIPLSNLRVGPDINLSFWKGILELNANLYAQRYRYRREDYNRYDSDFTITVVEKLSNWFCAYQEGEIEVTSYDHDDEICYDQKRTMVGLGPQINFLRNGRFRLGPRLRYERNHPLGSYHDYVEGSLFVSIEYIIGTFNIMIENEFGERRYEMEFYVGNTDYQFNELSVMTDLALFKRFNLQIITSYGPEWHTVPQDDSAFFLLSTRISYQF